MTIREFARQTGYTVPGIWKKIIRGELAAVNVGPAHGLRHPVWSIDAALVPLNLKSGVAKQRNLVRDVLLDAAERGTWMTIREIDRVVDAGTANVSYNLRILRQPKHGGYNIVRRHGARGYEYQIQKNTKIHNDTKVLAPHA